MSSPEVDPLLVDDHESAHQARPTGPCATPDPAADRRAVGMPPPRSSPRPPRLLIVDDDLGAIEVLVRTLAPIGECHFATTGEEAMLLAARLRPDAILLDGQMPGVDGFAVCAKLKAWPAFESVPIVFVTGFADPANEKRALDLGAADFIAKPYTPELLRARVRNLLGWVQAARQADAELQAARAQRSAADAAGRRTTLMMSCIAHEMGNPLNGLLGFAELIAETASESRVALDARTILTEALKMKAAVGRLTEFWQPSATADPARVRRRSTSRTRSASPPTPASSFTRARTMATACTTRGTTSSARKRITNHPCS